MDEKTLGEWALHYSELGFSVIPLHGITAQGHCTCSKGKDCHSPGKHPRIPWKEYETQLPTVSEVRGWWRWWPNSNIGGVTGEISGRMVLDVDGALGVQTLREKKLAVSPTIPHASTGGGGYHHFYDWPGFECRNFAGKIGHTILPNVDFRGDGGLVVLPPSLHASGKYYEWIVSPEKGQRVPPPDWLMALITGQQKQPAPTGGPPTVIPQGVPGGGSGGDGSLWVNELLLGVDQGRRDDSCARLAGYYLRKLRGDRATTLTILLSWDQRNRPPLESEVVGSIEKIVNSIASRQGTAELGGALGVTLVKIVYLKSPENASLYQFHFDVKGKIEQCELTGEDVISQTRFRAKVASTTNLILPPIEKNLYFTTLQQAVAGAETVELPPDTTQQGVILEILQRALAHSSSDIDDIDRRMVAKDGMLYFKVKLIQYSLDNSDKSTRTSIGSLLRKMKFSNEFRIYDSNQHRHRVWGMEQEKFDKGFPDLV